MVKNEGDYTETFSVTLYDYEILYACRIPICTFTVITLAPGSTVTLTIGVGFTRGFSTLSAYA